MLQGRACQPTALIGQLTCTPMARSSVSAAPLKDVLPFLQTPKTRESAARTQGDQRRLRGKLRTCWPTTRAFSRR